MSKEELDRLKEQIQKLEGFIVYFREKKLTKGLTDHEYKLYDKNKRDLSELYNKLSDEQGPQILTMNIGA